MMLKKWTGNIDVKFPFHLNNINQIWKYWKNFILIFFLVWFFIIFGVVSGSKLKLCLNIRFRRVCRLTEIWYLFMKILFNFKVSIINIIIILCCGLFCETVFSRYKWGLKTKSNPNRLNYFSEDIVVIFLVINVFFR